MLANIRGGGEFGPAWHEAGLKTHRQRIYDDFAAVAQDLIARKITSPRRLGIEGGSNGGLLMGVEFTQHPELWNAVDIQVPLLDMLRYEQIAGRRVVGGRVRQRVGSRGARVPGVDLAVPEPEAGRAVPGAVHLDHDQGRPRRPAARAQVRGEAARDRRSRTSSTRSSRAGTASGANLEERAHTSALEFTYFTRRLTD